MNQAVTLLPGRVLQLTLRPARRWMWLGAGWAALCGSVASGGLRLDVGTMVRLPALLFLADALLGTVWTALAAAADRMAQAPARGDRHFEATEPVETHRTARDDADSLSREDTLALAAVATPLPARAGRMAARWREEITVASRELQHWLIAVAATLAVAGLLGPPVAVLTGLGLLFPLVVAFAFGGHPLRGALTRATLEMFLPWSLGLAAFAPPTAINASGLADLTVAMVLWVADHGTLFVLAGLFSVAYYALLTADRPARRRWRTGLLNLPQGIIVTLLVVWEQPLLAGAAALLWLAQLPFQPYLRLGRVRWYLHHTQWFVMGLLLAASVAASLR